MKTVFKNITVALSAIALLLATFIPVVPEAIAADSYTLGPTTKMFDTQSAPTTQIVTNKVIATGVTALPNTYLLSEGKEFAFEFTTTGATPFTVGTNVVVTFSSSMHIEPTRTNRHQLASFTFTTNRFVTNIFIGARTYIYLDSVLPTGVTLTNAQINARAL